VDDDGKAPPALHDVPLLVETIVDVALWAMATQLPAPSVARSIQPVVVAAPPPLHDGPAIYTPITASMFELVVTGSEMV
jgi:hypothetical protein